MKVACIVYKRSGAVARGGRAACAALVERTPRCTSSPEIAEEESGSLLFGRRGGRR